MKTKQDNDIQRNCRQSENLDFSLGDIYVTSGLKEHVEIDEFIGALRRHKRGDWREVCPEDSKSNDMAYIFGGRLFSAYDS